MDFAVRVGDRHGVRMLWHVECARQQTRRCDGAVEIIDLDGFTTDDGMCVVSIAGPVKLDQDLHRFAR